MKYLINEMLIIITITALLFSLTGIWLDRILLSVGIGLNKKSTRDDENSAHRQNIITEKRYALSELRRKGSETLKKKENELYTPIPNVNKFKIKIDNLEKLVEKSNLENEMLQKKLRLYIQEKQTLLSDKEKLSDLISQTKDVHKNKRIAKLIQLNQKITKENESLLIEKNKAKKQEKILLERVQKAEKLNKMSEFWNKNKVNSSEIESLRISNKKLQEAIQIIKQNDTESDAKQGSVAEKVREMTKKIIKLSNENITLNKKNEVRSNELTKLLEHTNEVERKKQKLEEKVEKLDSFNQKLLNKSEFLNKIRTKYKRNIKKTLANFKNKQTELNKKLNKTQNELENLKNNSNQYLNIYDDLANTKDVLNTSNQILNKKNERLQRTVTFIENENKELIKKQANLEMELGSIKQKLNKINEQKKTPHEQVLAQLKIQYERKFQLAKKEQEKLNAQIDSLKKLLSDTQKNYIKLKQSYSKFENQNKKDISDFSKDGKQIIDKQSTNELHEKELEIKRLTNIVDQLKKELKQNSKYENPSFISKLFRFSLSAKSKISQLNKEIDTKNIIINQKNREIAALKRS